jgi:hypothetical protein
MVNCNAESYSHRGVNVNSRREEIDIAAKPASVDLRAWALAKGQGCGAIGADGPAAPRCSLT